MKAPYRFLFAFLAFSALGFAQNGVLDPPEMRGQAKVPPSPSAADLAFFDAIKGATGFDSSNLPALNKVIQDYPNYAIAYAWRANVEACGEKSLDISKAKVDFEAVLSHQDEQSASLFSNQDIYSLLAKIEYANGNRSAAISLLEKAMMEDLKSADKIFNIQGTAPETTSGFCTWNLTDLQKLASSAPEDWRPVAFEGLYYQFFTTFKEDYYPQATALLQKASLLNVRTPIIPYLQGELQMKSAFWTKKSWSSDTARNDLYKAAVPFFSKAIQLDRNFEHAYAERAEAYMESKQDALAIRDYDRLISIKPENASAHADRGLANFTLGQYYSAISDYSDAIRLNDGYLSNAYENRGDAYVKVQDYRRAIEDYSAAIEDRLESQIPMLSLTQFRGIYPEYTAVSDEVLLQKLHQRFAPKQDYSEFRKMMKDNGQWGVTFLLTNLYEKRGDAYLSIDDYAYGVLDFQRIFVGAPEYSKSTERWRVIGASGTGAQYYIDTKASWPLSNAVPRIWLKSVSTKGSEVMAFELDCSSRKYRVASSVSYDKNGNVVGNGVTSEIWNDVIPDTLGEQIWNGACQRDPFIPTTAKTQ
jgi:tetratricopeptide (TPR) repeat protein